jgi:hypothetical protein
MKKMVLLPLFTILSMILFSIVPLPVFTLEPEKPIGLPIEFSGLIALSGDDHVLASHRINLLIMVDGPMTVGVEQVSKYAIMKLLNDEIIIKQATLFNWKIKRCRLKLVENELDINLNVLWKAKSPTITGSLSLTFGDYVISFDNPVSYREADVRSVLTTYQGIKHRTGRGYIVDAKGVTGTITYSP